MEIETCGHSVELGGLLISDHQDSDNGRIKQDDGQEIGAMGGFQLYCR